MFLELCMPNRMSDEPKILNKAPDFAGSLNEPVELQNFPAMDQPMGNKWPKQAKFTDLESLAPHIPAKLTSFAASAAK